MGVKILMSNVQRMKGKEMDLWEENWMNDVLEKLKDLLVGLENLGASLIERVDGLFPPGTKERLLYWLQVAIPFIITAVVLLLCFCICSVCWGLLCFVVGRAIQIICLCCARVCRLFCFVVGKAFHVCCLCCRGVGSAVQMMSLMMFAHKLMKVSETDSNMPYDDDDDDDDIPGRNYRTRWDPIASNPRTYFRGLRGKPVDDDFDL